MDLWGLFRRADHNGSRRRRDHACVMAKEGEPTEMVDPLPDLMLRLWDEEGASSRSLAGVALPNPLDRKQHRLRFVGRNRTFSRSTARTRTTSPTRTRPIHGRGFPELRRARVAWPVDPRTNRFRVSDSDPPSRPPPRSPSSARVEACAELLEVLRSAESGATRVRAAELDAVPALVGIVNDFLDAHDDARQKRARDGAKADGVPGDDPDAVNSVATAGAPERCAVNALRCLIDLTREVATRLRLVDTGGIDPLCRLMDADAFAESLAERAAALLINCCAGGAAGDDPFSPAAKVREAIARSGGVGKIVNELRRSPHKPAGTRAVHLLSLIADDPGTRAAFNERGEAEDSFRALVPFLEMGGSRAAGEEDPPVSVKHAAVAANGLCVDSVANKEAFSRAGGIPPLMTLLGAGETGGKGTRAAFFKKRAETRARVFPAITQTVVDAVSTLAMDTDATDQIICDTGVLPFLVSLVGDPRCDASLSLAAVHAVMHMARDSRDAKRQLTEEGVVTKMRDIVEAYDPTSSASEALVVPAVSCLVNLAVDTEYWGQAELASEGVMEPVRRALARAAPSSKLAQVCVAFTHAFVKNNPDNGFIAAESGVLPVLAYHHLRGRDRERDERAAREALVTLGAAADADENARDVVAACCGELLLRECLLAGAGPGARVPPEIADDPKRLAKEKATLCEVVDLARAAEDGAAFARAADGARLARKQRRAREIFDAEAALEKKLVQQLAAREKELAEAEAAHVELRKAQARVGQALNAVKKEVNEARAAKKDLEAARRALAREIDKEGAGSKSAKSLAELVERKRSIWEKEQREADAAVATHSAAEAAERAARASFEREKAEADAAERAAEEAVASAAAREEKLDKLGVRARRRFLEQEEAAEAAAKKAARAAARAAERVANGEAEDVDLEAAEVAEEEEEEDDDDPFEKKCCVVM